MSSGLHLFGAARPRLIKAGVLPMAALCVMNGGEITLDDVALSVAADRPVLVVDESGRAADELAPRSTVRPQTRPSEHSPAPASLRSSRSTDPQC